jgi:hypothetical protein
LVSRGTGIGRGAPFERRDDRTMTVIIAGHAQHIPIWLLTGAFGIAYPGSTFSIHLGKRGKRKKRS